MQLTKEHRADLLIKLEDAQAQQVQTRRILGSETLLEGAAAPFENEDILLDAKISAIKQALINNTY